MNRMTVKDFAISFGTGVFDIIDKCGDIIDRYPLLYELFKRRSRDNIIIKILEYIDQDTQKIASSERTNVWHNGWQENLDAFIRNNGDLELLTPKFVRPNQPLRWEQGYIKAEDPWMELRFYEIFRQWVFKTYFSDVDNTYEFGCGTGYNLVALSKLFPNMNLYGSDFVQSSVDLVNNISAVHFLNVAGYLFDMIKPDSSIKLKKNSGVYTIGAIEQLGGKFNNFIHYLIDNKPKIVVHIEPTIELYDLNILEDYLAYKFHKKRGYTIGLLPYLQQLDREKIIKLEKVQRTYFGSLYMEGYNLIVWRPL